MFEGYPDVYDGFIEATWPVDGQPSMTWSLESRFPLVGVVKASVLRLPNLWLTAQKLSGKQLLLILVQKVAPCFPAMFDRQITILNADIFILLWCCLSTTHPRTRLLDKLY